MWGKSFHKLCGFQGIYTSVMWDKRRAKKTPWEWKLWGGVTQKRGRQGIGWNVQENMRQQPNTTDCNCWHTILLFAWTETPAMQIGMYRHINAQIYTHKWTIQGMLTATAPYAPSVLRGNLRNGTMRNFRYLKQSFTFLQEKGFKLLLFSESNEHLRLIHHLTQLVCSTFSWYNTWTKRKMRTNASALYAGIQQVAG